MPPDRTLLFLDFDGVICDSIEECFHSSAIAYFRRAKGVDIPVFSEAYRKAYREHRPFVRNGEDYLLIHALLSGESPRASQAEFDQARYEAGTRTLDEYLDAFTATRRDLVATDHAHWISLNPVYPFMRPLLPGLGARPEAYILSTKKAEFIVEILGAAGVDWRADRILSMQDRPKLEAIRAILDATASLEDAPARAIFVDDQIEHLARAVDGRVERYLALWGYALPGAQAEGVRPLSAASAQAMLEDFLKKAHRSVKTK